MSDEIWRLIPSLPGYLASSWGRVMRVPYVDKNGILRGGVPTFGYWDVHCTGKTYARYTITVDRLPRKVHQLVAEAFHGPRPDGTVVAHLDEDSGNNIPDNLKYVPQKINMGMPEVRRRLSESARLRWNNPEERQRASESAKLREERKRLKKNAEACIAA